MPQETNPATLLHSVLLSSKDGPRCGRTVSLHGCFSQARAPQQLPGEQDKQQDSSKNSGGVWPPLPEPAWAGLQKETRVQPPVVGGTAGVAGGQEAPQCQQPALIHQGRYIHAP